MTVIYKEAKVVPFWELCIEHDSFTYEIDPSNLLDSKIYLYLHSELICYHWQNKLDYHKKSLNNFDFILISNGSASNCDFIEKVISCSWKVETVKKVMNSIFNCCAAATK